MKKYYIYIGNEQQGPFDKNELKSKGLTRGSHVWQEGFLEWTKAGEIDELQDLFITPPPMKTQNIEKQNAAPKKSMLGKLLIIASIVVLILMGLFFYNLLQHQKVVEQLEQENRLQSEKDKAELEAKNKIRSTIYNYVTLTQNSIAVDNLLGGITNLTYTVANNCDYTLDNVKVRISYFKADGDVFKTEEINIRGVAPHTETKFNAPSSERGTSVREEISEIKSTDLSL